MKQNTSIFTQTSIEPPVGSGGGGGITIGQPVNGGNPTEVLYIDLAGNLFGDSQFTRESSNTKQTNIEANLYAQIVLNDGVTETQIQADNVGTVGNSIALVFDGVIDINTALANWNTANPSNTASVISGTGSEVIPASTVNLIGGGTAGIDLGEGSSVTLPNVQGSVQYAIDPTNTSTAFDIVGNMTTVLGLPSMGTIEGVFTSNGASFFATSNNEAQILVTDTISQASGMDVFLNKSRLHSNGSFFVIDSGVNEFQFNDSSGTNIKIPFGQTPSLNDVLTITNVSGSDYTAEFQPVSATLSNGTSPFQYWRWNDNAGTQGWDQVFILTETAISDQNVLVGDGAGVLTETSSAGYANTVVGTAAASSLSSVNSSEISRNVVVGANAADATLKMENSIVLGYQSLLGGTDQLIGSIIMTPDTAGSSSGNAINQNIALGYGTRIEGERNVVIGTVSFNSITSSATDNVSIGVASSSSLTNGQCNTSIGANSGSGLSTGDYNTFLGYGTSTGITSVSHSIALGSQAQLSADNQLVIGGIAGSVPQGAIYNILLNNGITDASLEKYSIAFPRVITTSDADGPEVTFNAGRGTGTGNGSAFYFDVSRPNGSSGSTSHSYFRLLSIQNNDVIISRGLVYDSFVAYGVNHTILPEEHIVRFLGAAANVDFTLPALSSVPAGKVYRIKDADGSAGSFTCRVVPDGTDTIDGSANYTFSSYEAIMLVADVANGNWEIY